MSTEIYVAVNGRKTHSGTQKGPFDTLVRARDTLRGLRAEERTGSTVWIGGGDYPLTETLRLGNRDGGRPDAPVTWRAMPKQRVRLLGGITLSGFTSVKDPEVRARLDPAARCHVRQVDLKSIGVGHLTPMRSRGFGRPMRTAHVELFVDGEPQTAGRWSSAGQRRVNRRPSGWRTPTAAISRCSHRAWTKGVRIIRGGCRNNSGSATVHQTAALIDGRYGG